MDRQIRQTIGSQGSIALEYVIMLAIGVVFFTCFLEVFQPGYGYTEYGQQLIAYFQRMLSGVAMPVP